ncbi:MULTISPECIES: glycosyltransferase family 4 protein [Acinetobacter]|uniref:glycosyltransferase family 4 protein n=1 Tax=Acinetobacter TaxID=469 RepID=UPI000EA2DCF7|nr:MULTISPECIES: glycosyltransferase family 1 protein [Acinetobacter]RKG46096.1 glycosyltransferase family 1 protein [Acinetobacter cumulans]RZG61264.1 glycosyltransferase family 1 protein [Acinetobacter sp. WCHAc060006]
MDKKLRKILYCSYEFRSSYQRGIYQFTKSMMDATCHLGYENYLLTQAREPSEIIQSLVDADHYVDNKFEELNAYIKFLLGNRNNFEICTSKSSNVDGFEYLSKLKGYVNSPLFYNSSHYSVLFPNCIGMTNIALDGFGENDIIFCSSPMTIKSNKHKVVQVVHDVMHLKDRSKWERYMYRRISAANFADKILTVSHHTRNEFLEFFPHLAERTSVIYQPVPVDDVLLKLSEDIYLQDQVLKKYGVERKSYMYYVGALNAGKNIHRMVEAYHLATGGDLNRPLLLSGKADQKYFNEHRIHNYLSSYEQPEKSKNIYLTGYVTDLEKLCLLRCCRAFLFPTLGEGFGIPVIEAQMCGAPVLTSNNTSLPEVTNGSALLIDNPLSMVDIYNGINTLWRNNLLCSKLSLKGYYNIKKFSKINFNKEIDYLIG